MGKIYDKKFIFDNAVFSNFSRIGRLDLLFHLSAEIITTREVVEEVKKGLVRRPKLQSIIEAIEKGCISVSGVESIESIVTISDLLARGQLGIGELSAMFLAREYGGYFLTDDRRAARTAIELDIDVLDKSDHRSTVTVLKILRREGFLSAKDLHEIVSMMELESFNFKGVTFW